MTRGVQFSDQTNEITEANMDDQQQVRKAAHVSGERGGCEGGGSGRREEDEGRRICLLAAPTAVVASSINHSLCVAEIN